MPTAMERFLAKARLQESGCLLWTAATSAGRYGAFWHSGKLYKAHRWIYENVVGPIPAGLVIDHICRNGLCVAVEHLRVVTQRENVLCGEAPAARQARRTHCIHGHELAGENLYLNPDGRKRECKTCRRAIDRRRKCPQPCIS
jgi:hypothetical protein